MESCFVLKVALLSPPYIKVVSQKLLQKLVFSCFVTGIVSCYVTGIVKSHAKVKQFSNAN